VNTTAGKWSEAIKKEALRNGFEHCGITPATAISSEEENNYRKWLEMGNYGGMAYLRDNFEKRLDPRNVLPGARSVIALLLNYYPAVHLPTRDNYIISKYAYGRDYHIIARNRLRAMEKFIRETDPGSECKSLIDSGVLMEKYLAEQCGVGWRGKEHACDQHERRLVLLHCHHTYHD
jgi:epoxyqueuosine reductase